MIYLQHSHADERRRAHNKIHGEKSKDEQLTGQDQFKVDTFLVALDEVNQRSNDDKSV